MKEGPEIALLASLVGDPGRANMLVALLRASALASGELAKEAEPVVSEAFLLSDVAKAYSVFGAGGNFGKITVRFDW